MNSIRWWTGTAILATAIGIGHIPFSAADDDKSSKDSDRSTKSTSTDKTTTDGPRSAMLGVKVEELHPALSSHLPGSGAKGQGLLVQSVHKDSPAGKAGIKEHDVLMTYDDQKLFTPEQFIKLVSGDKIGREVALSIIREGKSQTIKAQLAERTEGWHHGHHAGNAHERHHQMGGSGDPRDGQRFQSGQNQADDDSHLWATFDSLTLKKLDKDRFRASVAYTDKDGKLKKNEYEGTREELRTKIEADKDLMPIERFHLVRGLDLHSGGNEDDQLDF